MKRRQYLAGAVAGVTGALAGCTDTARSELGIGRAEARWNYEYSTIARSQTDIAVLVLGTVRNTGQRSVSFDLEVDLIANNDNALQSTFVEIEELAVDESQQWHVEFPISPIDVGQIDTVDVSSPDLDGERL